jgi:membrane-bound serine protease (ClpP class)
VIWVAVGLAVAGVVAIIVEMFVPALGLIGAAGLGAIVASIVMVFREFGALIGSIYLGVAIIVLPVLIVLYFKYLPRTFVGKRLIQQGVQDTEAGYASYTAEKYAGLPGKEGVALTVLRPVGTVLIEGNKHSAVTSGEFVDRNQPIVVVKVEGSRIVVRARRSE